MSHHVNTRVVGDGWTWLADYLFAKADWTLNCEPGRTCQVGMGIFFLGEPRGEKKRFTGHTDIWTLGIGAIHVRVVDGRGPCSVRLDLGKFGTLPIIKKDNPLSTETLLPTDENAGKLLEQYNIELLEAHASEQAGE